MSGIIEFKNVSIKFYGKGKTKHEVLEDFCYEATAGINCLLGSTGCGKTTLLRLAAGLIKPQSGIVTINKKAAGTEPAGYISQHNTLLPWKNLAENVSLPLRIKSVAGRKRIPAAEHALERVGLSGRGEAFPHECSGGMKQRAMLARQLLHPSRFWLLDEPFSSLDMPTRRELQNLLKDLQKENNLTILMVTHDIDEAVNTSHNIALMPKNGRGNAKAIEPGKGDEKLRSDIERQLIEDRGTRHYK